AENRHLDAALPRANLKNQPNPPCKASGKGNAFINACFFSTLLKIRLPEVRLRHFLTIVVLNLSLSRAG
ncbi:MAG: hypothetical protein M3Y72_23260, partial [Acidobacteriota bacterium]|nr:hypothetical protein [Acidobacteriota bacterium]